MIVQVIQRGSDPLGDVVLRSMFEARKRVFVDLLKWQVPVVDGHYELDQFDDCHARYLVISDSDGAHLASARLLPTTRPHLLRDVFAALCDAPPPVGADIFEITRFCLDRSLRATERRRVRDLLVSTLVDHAVRHGIRSYTAIAEIGWFQQILAFGWRCEPLGPPRIVAGEMLAALRIEITSDTASRLSAAGIIVVAASDDADRLAA